MTKDMSLGFLVVGDTPLGLSVTGDVSLGHRMSGDVSLGIPVTGDMSLGCLATRDVSLGHTEAGDLQVQGTCWVLQQRVGLQVTHVDGDTQTHRVTGWCQAWGGLGGVTGDLVTREASEVLPRRGFGELKTGSCGSLLSITAVTVSPSCALC